MGAAGTRWALRTDGTGRTSRTFGTRWPLRTHFTCGSDWTRCTGKTCGASRPGVADETRGTGETRRTGGTLGSHDAHGTERTLRAVLAQREADGVDAIGSTRGPESTTLSGKRHDQLPGPGRYRIEARANHVIGRFEDHELLERAARSAQIDRRPRRPPACHAESAPVNREGRQPGSWCERRDDAGDQRPIVVGKDQRRAREHTHEHECGEGSDKLFSHGRTVWA